MSQPSGPQKRKGGPSLDERLGAHVGEAGSYQERKKNRPNNLNKFIKKKRPLPPATPFAATVGDNAASAWADSDDENRTYGKVDKDGNQRTRFDVKLIDKSSKKKLRTDRSQYGMGQAEYIDAQRTYFENTFQTPDWAKVDEKKSKNVAKAAFVDSEDDNNSSGDENSSDQEDEDDEDYIKTEQDESIKLESNHNNNNNTKHELNNQTKTQKDGEVIELQYESEDAIRIAQESEQERTLEQLEKLFAQSGAITTGASLSNKNLHKGTLTGGTLRPNKILIDRIIDANAAAPSKSLLSSVGWHDNNQLLFTAGMDKCLRLFQMDGVNNPCVQSLYFDLMPIFKAGFINHQSEILVTGRRKFFQVVNLVTAQVTKIPEIKGRSEKSLEYWVPSNNSTMIALIGDNATILIISAITKQFICEIRCKGGLNDLVWSADDQFIFTTGNDGLIYSYNVAQRQQAFTYRDVGVHQGTTLGMSPNGKYFATGSTNGMVNVYNTDFESLLEASNRDYTQDSFASYYGGYTSYEENVKMPLAELPNLTTKVDHISFSPSSEIMAIASRDKKDAVRLVHLPSFTTFANWPTQYTPFSYVQDIAWSADNTKLAFANDKGRVLLYHLGHYKKNCNLD